MHVAVVGAGMIGLCTAVRLRAAGHRVTVIAPELPSEAGRPVDASAATADAAPWGAFRPDGATTAAAGMLAPLAETQHSQDALAPLLAAGADRWPAQLRRLARWTDAPTGHDARGSLVVGADRADVDQWAHVLARAEHRGRRAEPLTSSALRRRAPALAPGLAGGFAAPDDHALDPRRTARACLAALLAPVDRRPRQERDDRGPSPALDAGPPELVRGRVRAVVQSGEAVQVTVDREAHGEAADGLGADVVVLAAGLGRAEIGGAPAAEPVPLRPVHGDVLRLRMPATSPGGAPLLPGPVRALVHGRSVYLVPRDDGELVVGATVREDRQAGTPAGAVLDLLADAAVVLPEVRECVLAEVSTAARPGTPDDLPHVGALAAAPRVLVATGGHRHGILLAPWIADAVLGLAERAAGLPVTDPDALELTATTRPDRFRAGPDRHDRDRRPAAARGEDPR